MLLSVRLKELVLLLVSLELGFSQSLITGDAVPTGAPTVGAVPNFSDVTSHSSGVAGSLAGSVTSAGVVSLTAGGQGTVATGSVVSSVTVK